MQQRPTGGADASGAMPDPYRQPTEYLLAFLNRIAMLDKEGFFQRPVREEEAPNYYSIIKQPMCFSDMREKIIAGSYQTWRQLRDDFNLIHENARRFNSNKTLVHRAALNLQKNGTKILATYELEVRKALAALHPLGSQQPTPGAAPGSQAPPSGTTAMAADTRMDLVASPAAAASASGAVLAADQNGDGLGQGGGGQRPSMSGPPSPEGVVDTGSLPMSGSAPAQPQAFPSILVPPAQRDPLVGYISDEDEQPLLVVGTDAAAATSAAAASRSLPGVCPSHALPLDALLSQLRTAAIRLPYSRPGRRKKGEAQTGSGGASGVEGAAEGVTSAGTDASPIFCREWRQARRPVELRARWLELRMRELRSHQDRLQAQISWLQQRKAAGGEGVAAAALAAGLGRPAVGVLTAAAGLATAPCAAQRGALGSAAGEFMSGGRISSSLYFRLRTAAGPAQGAAVSGSPLAPGDLAPASPGSVAAAAGAEASAANSGESGRQPQALEPSTSGRAEELRRLMPPLEQQQQPGTGRPAAQPQLLFPQQLQPCDEAESDKMLPGAIFASLELLEQRLLTVRGRLQDSYKFDPNRLSMGRTQGPYAARMSSYQLASSGSLAAPGAAGPGPQMLPSGASAGPGAVKRQSSGHGRRPGSLTVLTRFDSMTMPGCKSTGAAGDGKRKRSEIELLTGDIGTPLTSYGRTSLDRSTSVSAIVIPPVRDLPPDEFRARIVAATTWSQHYHTIGPSALDTVPPEIVSVLRKRRRRGFLAPGEDYDEDMGVGMEPGAGRGMLGTSDDEGGALLAGGLGGPVGGFGGYSDSGVGDDEGSSSSSEDTSDEAYAARHRIMEEEEHRRYQAVVAEGQRRRNKGGSNASAAQQNQAGPSGGAVGGGPANQAKDRAKLGHKTPRYSNSFKLKEGLVLVPPELPPDSGDPGPPSAVYGHYQMYQPYQPPMVGVAMTSVLPPTPGSTPAAVLAQPQPVIVQQAVAQRTSSPPAALQVSPPSAPGQALHRQSTVTSTSTVLPPPAASPAASGAAMAAAGRPLAPPPPQQPQPAQCQQAPAAQTAQQQQQPAPAEAAAELLTAGTQCPSQQQQTLDLRIPPPPPQQQQAHGQGPPQLQQPMAQPGEVQPPSQQQPLWPQQQQQPPAPGRQQDGPPEAQVPQFDQQQQQSAKSQPPAAPEAGQPQPSGSDGRAPPTEPAAPASGASREASGHTAAAAVAGDAAAAGTAGQPPAQAESASVGGAAAQPGAASGSGAASSEASAARAELAGQQHAGAAQAGRGDTTAGADASGGGAAAAGSDLAATAAAACAAEKQSTGAGAGAAAAAAAAAAAGVLTGQAQQLAMAVGQATAGGNSLLGNSAAAMIAQSPAMSMQFLAGMSGLGTGGGGNGGSSNALSAAATSILLAAVSAASSGGQSAANNLMGSARANALQQLAAGAPAAQVFANAAAAAAAAAAAGAPGGGAGSLTAGLGQQQGKSQPTPPLFTAANARGLQLTGSTPNQTALTAAGGIAGLGNLSGLPAAFQSLQGFPQSLAGVAGFNLNLAGGSGLGLGQRLSDGLGSLGGMAVGLMPQGAQQQQQLQQLQQHLQQQQLQQQQQQLQQQYLQGMQAPALPQGRGQLIFPADGGRGGGGGRGRRASRTTVVEEEDEEWGEDDEEEEAASPGSRTRRSTRTQRRGSNGVRGADGHGNGNGGQEGGTRQSRRRAGKGTHNWAVLLASDSSDEEEDEEWAARAGRRSQEGGRGRGRGRRPAG